MIAARGFISTQVLVTTQIINMYYTYVTNGKTISKNKNSCAGDRSFC